MSAVTDALEAIRKAVLLADEVKRAGARLDALASELRELDRRTASDARELDRRVTRLEAQWETAMAFAGARHKPPALGHEG